MAVIGITGSTDGIGRATARVLLADGRRVLVLRTQSGAGGTRCESIGWRRRFGGSAADTSVSATPGCWLAVLDTNPLGAAGQRAPGYA
jgi:NAD(P)-dependent dehydrogenase (short-subunit alcohol dehydrogenase family)